MFNIIQNVATGSGANSSSISSISDIFGIVLNVLIGVGFAISLASIGYSAIMYILSAGDPKAVSQAWNAFIWGVFAASFSIGALAIKSAIIGLIGTTSTEITNALPGF